MHFELSTEQTMLVDTVRSFVEKELYPHEAEVERLDEVPAELAQHLEPLIRVQLGEGSGKLERHRWPDARRQVGIRELAFHLDQADGPRIKQRRLLQLKLEGIDALKSLGIKGLAPQHQR